MDSSVSPKDKIWFLRMCHHISNGLQGKSIQFKFQRTRPNTGLFYATCIPKHVRFQQSFYISLSVLSLQYEKNGWLSDSRKKQCLFASSCTSARLSVSPHVSALLLWTNLDKISYRRAPMKLCTENPNVFIYGHFTRRPNNGFMLRATLNLHKSALFHWNGTRLYE